MFKFKAAIGNAFMSSVAAVREYLIRSHETVPVSHLVA